MHYLYNFSKQYLQIFLYQFKYRTEIFNVYLRQIKYFLYINLVEMNKLIHITSRIIPFIHFGNTRYKPCNFHKQLLENRYFLIFVRYSRGKFIQKDRASFHFNKFLGEAKFNIILYTFFNIRNIYKCNIYFIHLLQEHISYSLYVKRRH